MVSARTTAAQRQSARQEEKKTVAQAAGERKARRAQSGRGARTNALLHIGVEDLRLGQLLRSPAAGRTRALL